MTLQKVKNLQELIDKALANPDQYGSLRFFDDDGNPVCPLAKEVIPDLGNEHNQRISTAAYRLNCSKRAVSVFTTWWDSQHDARANLLEVYKEACIELRELGFKILEKERGAQ